MGIWSKRQFIKLTLLIPSFYSVDGHYWPIIGTRRVRLHFARLILRRHLSHRSAGYLEELKGWRAALRLLAAIHLALFMAHVALGPETLFLDRGDNSKVFPPARKRWRQYAHFCIYDHTPLKAIEFVRPFLMFSRPVVLLPALAYALVFVYTIVLVVRGSSQFRVYLNHLLI